MAVRVACPACSITLSVPDHLVGKKIRCKTCQEVFVAEGQDEPSPPPELRREESFDFDERRESLKATSGPLPLPPPPPQATRKAPLDATRTRSIPKPASTGRSILPLVLAGLVLVLFFAFGIGIGVVLVWASPGVVTKPANKPKAAWEGEKPREDRFANEKPFIPNDPPLGWQVRHRFGGDGSV